MITLLRSLQEIGRMHDWLDRVLIDRPMPDRMLLAIRVCLEEAVSNVIRHGRGDGPIDVDVTLWPAAAVATVVDTGPPFDPTTHVPAPPDPDGDPGGRGIRLMRAYASAIEYERQADTNRLLLRFGVRTDCELDH